MKNLNNSLFLRMGCMMSILWLCACQGSSSHEDLISEILATKKTVLSQTPKKTVQATNYKIPTIKYEGAEARDPFEPSRMPAKASSSKLHPLNAFPLSEIRFVGVIINNDETYAIVMTPDDHTYQVKIGDQLGNQYGKIVNITQEQIDVIETVNDDKNRPQQQTVTIRFKG